MAEASNSQIDALISLINSRILDINTSIPGTIVDYADGLASVRPTGRKRFADGEAIDYPVIHNARVCWPSFAGGAAGIKGPVTPGDKCLLVFAQQAIDGTDDRRAFDLQDCHVVMVDLGNTCAGDSANNDDMTMYFGAAHIRISAAGALSINAPGGTTINTPETINTGKLTTQGLLTYQQGMAGQGGGSITQISGSIVHTGGSILSLGNKIDGSHTHPDPQGGNTGAPNA